MRMQKKNIGMRVYAPAASKFFAIVVLCLGLGWAQLFLFTGESPAATPAVAKKDLSSAQRLEIDHLLHYIENSACLFRRNDGWYGAREAANHIRSKYRYLVERGQIASSEEFIVKAASQSSLTGRLYLVRCATQEKSSSQWLDEELQRYRNEHPAPAK